MDRGIVFFILGMVVGAAGALVLTGLMLWWRAPKSSSESDLARDRSVRVIPISASEWIVETDGRRYRQWSEVRDEAVAQRLQAMLAGLSRFAERPDALPAAAATGASPEVALADRGMRSRLSSLLQPAAAGRASPESPAALGIAGQIEQILQRQLERTPDWRGHRIHIGSAPDGSLRVEVNGKFYPGLEAVPAPAIQEILRAAIKEWEAMA